ncbi:methylmalonyl-CoA mutase family protein [Terricaulis sp.]|uniref:methylmalonyl-CoA mutase family protein n=1 Tax=Terricaulis sp. TaxID=2768686 RepID=UPI0037841629
MSEALSLGAAADEADWRALVEHGLKGAPWARLVGKTADGIAIQPLYRESDIATATDVSGFPGGAPFVRGDGRWTIRQAFDHPDPAETNREIIADLEGGVAGVELVVDATGAAGVAIANAGALDVALADVILEAAPVSLDAGAHALTAATFLEAKLKGVAARGTAFNLDPVGVLMRTGAMAKSDVLDAAGFAQRVRLELPAATSIRVDARPVHEAGGTEAQEIGAALASGIFYLRALQEAGAAIDDAGAALNVAISVGPDVLIETAKLRALRLCWARVMEASGAPAKAHAIRIHAFTSRRMLTRYDAWTNILRVTTAAFGAAAGGADDITTYPLTDALGLPTPFGRRVARNTQQVLLEECHLGHVADPAGGAWFVEKMTRELAAAAWDIMQLIEARGGIVSALQAGLLQDLVGGARMARQRAIASRKETITGVTDYPLLDAKPPEVLIRPAVRGEAAALQSADTRAEPLLAIRWAAPFEALRDKALAGGAHPVFFATLGPLAQFGARAQFARNLFAAGGVGSAGEEVQHASRDAMIEAFRRSRSRVAMICGADGTYAEEAENAAQRLKAAGADWLVLAGRPGDLEERLRQAGVDQFVFTGQDAVKELQTLHAALGISG